MASPSTPEAHRRYYGQFVDNRTKTRLLASISKKEILASTDEYFNDIPLRRWDALVPGCPGSAGFAAAGDCYTLGGGVCMLKEAARQIKEKAYKP